MIRKSNKQAGPEKVVVARFSPPAPSSGNRGWLFVLFLVASTLTAYLPVWQAGFVWDDALLLTGNPLIKDPHGWYRFWFTTKTPDYFPVMSSAFWLEWRLWGMNAVGYHVVNVLLHAANAILLWRLLARLGIPGAKLAAAIFALHPVNVESVAWIAELKNTLSLFFFTLSLLSYLKFEDTTRRRFYWLALGAFLFSLLSKIEAAPLPFVLLGIAWWRRNRIERKDIWRTVPFFAAAFLLGLVSIWFQNHIAIGHDVVRTDGFLSRLAGAGWAVWFYFYKTILPVNLLPIYPRWHIDAADWLSYVPGLLLVAVFFLCWQFRRTWGKAILIGLGYAVMMFLPVLGFLNIYFFRFSLVSDHWQYFSIIAPIALASAGLTMALDRFGNLKIFFCGALLLLLGALTWRQADIYRDSQTLWRAALAGNPNSWPAHNDLGFALFQKGDVDEAITQFQKALQINPDYAGAHNNLGNALLQKGDVDEALAHFQKALQIKPDYADAYYNIGNVLLQKGDVDEAIANYQQALQIKPDDAEAHNNLGNALLQKGKMDEAITHYQQALQIKPDDAEAHNNLGNALLKKGKTDEAVAQFQKALQINPDDAEVHNNLGNALLQKGRMDEAVAQFQKALQINPDDAEASYNLGNALLQKGNADEAIIHFQKALQIKPGYAEAHNNLGNALLQKGRVDEAIAHYQQALQIKPDYAKACFNLGNALLQKGGVDEAITCYQRALEIKPDYADAHNNLGEVLLQKGKKDEAIVHFKRAVELARAAGRQDILERLNAELKQLQSGTTIPSGK